MSRFPFSLPALLLLALLSAACAPQLPSERLLRQEPRTQLPQRAEQLARLLATDPSDVELLRRAAIVDARLGRGATALAHALRAVQEAPFDALNLLVLGEAYEAATQLLRAQQAYSQAIDLDPDLIPAYVGNARLLHRQGRRDDAHATLTEALRREPRHFGAWMVQARLRLREGDAQAALHAVREARGVRPRDGEAILLHARILHGLGKLDAAITLLDTLLESPPAAVERRAVLGTLVRLRRARGDWAQALALLAELEHAQALHPEEWLLKVEVLRGSGRRKEAEQSLGALVRAHAGFAPARVRQAEYRLRAGALDAAVRAAGEAAALDPGHAEAHYWLAAAHHLRGEPAPARAALAVAKRLEPDHPAVQQLGVVWMLAAQRLEDAAAALERFAEARQEHPARLLLRAELATLGGDHALTAALLQRIPPRFAPAAVRFARLRSDYLQGRHTQVREGAEALATHPLLGWRVAYLHASALLRLGRYGEAITRAQSWLDGERAPVLFHYVAGYAYRLQGKRVEARRTFLAGLALAPGHPLMIEGLSRMAMEAEEWPRAQELLEQGLAHANGYRPLFLDRLSTVSLRRRDAEASRGAVERYLAETDPIVRADIGADIGTTVLYGAYVPAYTR